MNPPSSQLYLYMSRIYLVLSLLVLGCKPEATPDNNLPVDPWAETFTEMTYSVGGIQTDDRFNPILVNGIVESNQLKEASGLAPCSYRNDWLYAHNDGGDYNRFFILDTAGRHIKSVIVPFSGNRDMEDMAVDPTPIDGNTYIYLGDIGDNDGVYPEIKIYRVKEEPFLDNGRDTTSQKAETFTFVYPDGPRDAEAMFVDPWSHHLYIFTKRDSRTRVYKASYPFDAQKTTTLQKVATLPFSGIVGGDMSFDGKHIVLKTYLQAFYWERNANETVVTALSRQPKLIPYKFEKQGEAICWSRDAREYYTVSEGQNEPIYRGSSK